MEITIISNGGMLMIWMKLHWYVICYKGCQIHKSQHHDKLSDIVICLYKFLFHFPLFSCVSYFYCHGIHICRCTFRILTILSVSGQMLICMSGWNKSGYINNKTAYGYLLLSLSTVCRLTSVTAVSRIASSANNTTA